MVRLQAAYRDLYLFVIHSENDRDTLRSFLLEYADQCFGSTVLHVTCVDTGLGETDLGSDFKAEIRQKIDDSDLVIAILTKNSCSSVWVNQEIGYSVGRRKIIIPLIENAVKEKLSGFVTKEKNAVLFDYGKLDFNRLDRYFTKEYGHRTLTKPYASKREGTPSEVINWRKYRNGA